MSRPRGWIRSSETNRSIDYADKTKPAVVGRLIDNNHLIGKIPESPAEEIDSVRQHIRERMHDVEDGMMLAATLGIRWRDIGDWPADWPIDSR
jgi:hypothetical protein